jgi:hypothetical protein
MSIFETSMIACFGMAGEYHENRQVQNRTGAEFDVLLN